jgi:hypothetical protein
MPGPGTNDDDSDGPVDVNDLVGFLNASAFRTISSFGELSSVSASAVFQTVEVTSDDADADVKTVGDCTITTLAFDDVSPVTSESQPLDAGAMGALSNGPTTALLTWLGEGVYGGPSDLANQGFAAGQTIAFEFPGGADVGAFLAPIDLPGELTVSAPDLFAADLSIDTTAALSVEWSADGTADQVSVVISTSNATTIVTLSCTFGDSGSETIPQAAMECLLADALSTSITVTLTNNAVFNVNLEAGGTGAVQLTAQSGLSRSLTASQASDGFDVCQFIDCPEGQTCNPETFLCE